MPVGMGEPEDADPAKIRSVIQWCGEFGINRLGNPARAVGRGAGGKRDP
jgi:hypothetical protein